MHADRTNRTLLIVLATILVAAGGLGGALAFGAFGKPASRRALTDNPVVVFLERNDSWFWPVAAVVAAVLVLACLRWLLAVVFSTGRTGDVALRAGGSGATTLASDAVPRAVSAEIEDYLGVSSAGARLLGDPDSPELAVAVTIEDSADLPSLRDRIENEALAHARSALDDPDLPIRLDLTVGEARSARVR